VPTSPTPKTPCASRIYGTVDQPTNAGLIQARCPECGWLFRPEKLGMTLTPLRDVIGSELSN